MPLKLTAVLSRSKLGPPRKAHRLFIGAGNWKQPKSLKANMFVYYLLPPHPILPHMEINKRIGTGCLAHLLHPALCMEPGHGRSSGICWMNEWIEFSSLKQMCVPGHSVVFDSL